MPGDREDQFVLDLVHGTGEVAHRLRFVGEGDHEKLVLRIRGLEELDHSIFRPVHLAAHASAGIEDHAQRYRSILARKCSNLLRTVAFEELEIRLVEARHQAVHGVGDRDRHQHQVHVDLQRAHAGGQPSGRRNQIGLGRLGCFLDFPRRNVYVVHVGLARRGDANAHPREEADRQRQP